MLITEEGIENTVPSYCIYEPFNIQFYMYFKVYEV